MNPPALTAVLVITAWRAEPGILVASAVLGVSYLAAVRSTRRAGRSWPFGRIVCFASGIVTLEVIGCSFLGVYGDALFWVRAVQNILLLMAAPMLLALGAPVRLATDLFYFWTRFRIDPTPRADPYGVTIWITVVEMIGDAVLGVVLWLGPLVAAGYYAALARESAPTCAPTRSSAPGSSGSAATWWDCRSSGSCSG